MTESPSATASSSQLGGYERDCTRIQNGGIFALVSAYAAIASRSSSVAVVSSVDAVKTDTLAVSVFSSHPFFDQPLHLNTLTSYALLATSLQHHRGLASELRDRIASRNYCSGAENPAAHIQRRYSPEDVLSSGVVASPLRRLDVSLISSTGEAALILAGEKRARKSSFPSVWIRGIGMSTSGIRHEQQVQLTAVKEASRRAYEMAGIDDPFRMIDIAEVHTPFALYELAVCEALELCPGGDVNGLVESGGQSGDGPVINASGGSLCTNARNSGGLFRVSQAIRQLHEMPSGKSATALVHPCPTTITRVSRSAWARGWPPASRSAAAEAPWTCQAFAASRPGSHRYRP